ncbi:hypothetical protein DFH08DRAFT_1078143 [Mycena albidolilacea]|uniref:Uncharacterized protein n=1 Tax=Mycena albidolilacea TaxID=1033008 RepID=A0AAD7A981_9AGAR|nr:hypothetical protein DFH08DRAFT_1078143 [Mycena albidolilacea]
MSASTTISKPAPCSVCIEKAIRKTIESSTPALRKYIQAHGITEQVLQASDEALESFYHTGELALQHCFLQRLYTSPRVERPCGYYKTIKTGVLSVTSLALLVTNSDLHLRDLSDCIAAEVIFILFGILSRHLDGREIQHSFNALFDPIVRSADAAYVAYIDRKSAGESTPQKPRKVEPRRFVKVRDIFQTGDSSSTVGALAPQESPAIPIFAAARALTRFSRDVKSELDVFLAMAPADLAFSSVFWSGADPIHHPPTCYERAGAPSPPPPPRRRLLPRHTPVASLTSVPRRRKAYPPTYSALLASASASLSPPPSFSLGRRNRTLIINPPHQY